MNIPPEAMMRSDSPAPPTWRSILFVPVTSDRFLAKAHQRGADAVQLDLEDSVPLDAKVQARQRLPAAVAQLAGHGVEVIVRINKPWLDAIEDLRVAVRPGVRAITCPKVEDPGHLRALDEIVAELEAQAGLPVGGIGFLLLIESPAALPRLHELASACPRVLAMTLGPEDYALAAGCTTDPEALMVPSMLVAQAASAAGIRALGFVGSIAEYGEPEVFAQRIAQARRLGFKGAQVIHPAQVAVLNELFAPSAEELDWARRVLEATGQAAAEGRAAFSVDGKMVDRPIIERARRIAACAPLSPGTGTAD